MAEQSFQLPKLTPMWTAIIIAVPCSALLAIVLCVWSVVGYQRWAIQDTVGQYSAMAHAMGEAHEKSVFSTIVVAAMLSVPMEERVAAVEAVCPETPAVQKLHESKLQPEQALCATLMTIFKASTTENALDMVEEVQGTLNKTEATQ